VIFGSNYQAAAGLAFARRLSIVTALDKIAPGSFGRPCSATSCCYFMIAKLCDSRDKLKWVFRIIIAAHIWLIYPESSAVDRPDAAQLCPQCHFSR
jgi:hypothetical protein